MQPGLNTKYKSIAVNFKQKLVNKINVGVEKQTLSFARPTTFLKCVNLKTRESA